MRFFAASGALHNHRLHPPRGTPAPLRRALVFHPELIAHFILWEVQSLPGTTVSPFHRSKLPLFAPFAVPKIGNMATAWHEMLHLGTRAAPLRRKHRQG